MGHRIHNGTEWSSQHQALLIYLAERVLKSHPRRGFVEIDDLISEGWLNNLRHRRADQLKGCGTFTRLRMYEALQFLSTGRHGHARKKHPVRMMSLDSDRIELDVNPALARDDPGFDAVDLLDAMAQIEDPKIRHLIEKLSQGHTTKAAAQSVGLIRQTATNRLRSRCAGLVSPKKG